MSSFHVFFMETAISSTIPSHQSHHSLHTCYEYRSRSRRRLSITPNCRTVYVRHARIPSGGGGAGQGVRTLPENHKYIGLFSNSGPDPLKNQEATEPAFNTGPSSSLKWRFAGRPMLARLKWYLDPPIPHQLKKRKKTIYNLLGWGFS